MSEDKMGTADGEADLTHIAVSSEDGSSGTTFSFRVKLDERETLVARIILRQAQELLEMMKKGDGSKVFIYPMMLKLREMESEGEMMTLGEAYEYIPAKHLKTSKKYMEQAEKDGLVLFKPHPFDKRKTVVVPTKKLLEEVDEEIKRNFEPYERFCTHFVTNPAGK